MESDKMFTKEDFMEMSEDELIEVLNENNLSEYEFEALIKARELKGLNGSIIKVSDFDSQEAKVIREYIEYHNQFPYLCSGQIPQKELKKFNQDLFKNSASLEDKKRALIVLGHTADIFAYKSLKKYIKRPDSDLKIWANMAFQECQDFLKSDLTNRPIINITNLNQLSR